MGASMVLTAKTTTEAKNQANKMVKALKDKPFTYAILVYVGGSTYSSMNKANVTSIASEALTTLEAANYFAVLYMDLTFSNKYIDTAALAAKHANEYVLSLDGDLLIHPDDMKKILTCEHEFVGGGNAGDG